MFCQNCGQGLDSEIKFCGSCGFEVDGTKINTQNSTHHHIKGTRFSGKRTPTRFIVLYFATLGVYPLFWMYDQWTFLKNKQNLNISPGWRAVFSPLWTGSLAGGIQKYLKKENINVSYSPILIGITFFILSALYRLPDPYWLITFLSFIPILPILDAMNQYYEKHDSHLPDPELAWWQNILVGVGLLILILAVYGTLYP